MRRLQRALLPRLGLSLVALASLAVVFSMSAHTSTLLVGFLIAVSAAAGLSRGGAGAQHGAVMSCVVLALVATMSRPASLAAPVLGQFGLLGLVVVATCVCRGLPQLETVIEPVSAPAVNAPGRQVAA